MLLFSVFLRKNEILFERNCFVWKMLRMKQKSESIQNDKKLLRTIVPSRKDWFVVMKMMNEGIVLSSSVESKQVVLTRSVSTSPPLIVRLLLIVRMGILHEMRIYGIVMLFLVSNSMQERCNLFIQSPKRKQLYKHPINLIWNQFLKKCNNHSRGVIIFCVFWALLV